MFFAKQIFFFLFNLKAIWPVHTTPFLETPFNRDLSPSYSHQGKGRFCSNHYFCPAPETPGHCQVFRSRVEYSCFFQEEADVGLPE